jgi:hypothetical protein
MFSGVSWITLIVMLLRFVLFVDRGIVQQRGRVVCRSWNRAAKGKGCLSIDFSGEMDEHRWIGAAEDGWVRLIIISRVFD